MNKQKAVEVLKYYEQKPYFFSGDAPAMNAFRIAISAHEKQIPKKPVRPYESNYKLYFNCPNYGSSGMHDVHKHCWRCGQKLDWGEEGSE